MKRRGFLSKVFVAAAMIAVVPMITLQKSDDDLFEEMVNNNEPMTNMTFYLNQKHVIDKPCYIDNCMFNFPRGSVADVAFSIKDAKNGEIMIKNCTFQHV